MPHNQGRDAWYDGYVALLIDMAGYIHDTVTELPTGRKIYTAEEKVLLSRMEEAKKDIYKTKQEEEEDGL